MDSTIIASLYHKESFFSYRILYFEYIRTYAKLENYVPSHAVGRFETAPTGEVRKSHISNPRLISKSS